MNKYLYAIIPISIFLFSLLSSTAYSKPVLVTNIKGPITQATVELIDESIGHAKSIDAEAILLTIDTPGGDLEDTMKITETIEQSSIPFIGYVYPRGATAWSAGTFILLSTQIAAMENHTIMGSCQPVEITPSGSKPINDTKYINALKRQIMEEASLYGRNSTIAGRFVSENLNLNATEALNCDIIDFVAPTIRELLDKIDETTIGGKTLLLKNVSIEYHHPSLKYHMISALSDPMIYSLLLIIGIFSLIFGIHTPGHGAEVFGIIALILSLLGMGFYLPYVSIMFLIIGAILILIEIFITPGFGFIGIGGIISIILGAIFLVPSYSNMGWLISQQYQDVLLLVAILPTILIAAFFLFALYKIAKIRNKKSVLNVFKGEEAETLDGIKPRKMGYIKYRGEYWLAKSDEIIPPHTKVIIDRKDGPILVVHVKKESKD